MVFVKHLFAFHDRSCLVSEGRMQQALIQEGTVLFIFCVLSSLLLFYRLTWGIEVRNFLLNVLNIVLCLHHSCSSLFSHLGFFCDIVYSIVILILAVRVNKIARIDGSSFVWSQLNFLWRDRYDLKGLKNNTNWYKYLQAAMTAPTVPAPKEWRQQIFN